MQCVSTEMKEGYILAEYEIEENGEKNENSSIFEIEENEEKNEDSSISESELECRIDPNIFAGEWLEHKPTTPSQKQTLALYEEAKNKGRLHTFTCMTVDPSVKDGKLVYQKGLPITTGFSQSQWAEMMKDYNPSRNSRQMTRTEYVCRNLFLIQRLVESGYKIEEAWIEVCDDSKDIGHYCNSYNAKDDFEPTGSREVCGFCDLANAWKFIAKDPWEEAGGFWAAGGSYHHKSNDCPVNDLYHRNNVNNSDSYGVGMMAFD